MIELITPKNAASPAPPAIVTPTSCARFMRRVLSPNSPLRSFPTLQDKRQREVNSASQIVPFIEAVHEAGKARCTALSAVKAGEPNRVRIDESAPAASAMP